MNINSDSRHFLFIHRTCVRGGNHSKSYLRHLFAGGEPLATRLATMHNLKFYLNLMKKIRTAITYDYFQDMVKSYKEING